MMIFPLARQSDYPLTTAYELDQKLPLRIYTQIKLIFIQGKSLKIRIKKQEKSYVIKIIDKSIW